MAAITHTAAVGSRFDAVVAAVVGACAEFCAGARQGREIETRYHALARRSGADLEQLGLSRADIARVALNDRLV